MSEFTRNLAIVIGIDRYENGIAPLATAVNDATQIARILKDKHGYEVQLWLNQNAGLPNLQYLLKDVLPKVVTKDDRLLFYFAGHGIALHGEDGPEGYLIPQDARLGNTQSYLPMVQLNEALSQLRCRHFLAILDCCFAGAFRWSSTRDIADVSKILYRQRYDRFIQDPAWQVITSAASDQKALDILTLQDDRGQVGKHSPFATALMSALAGKADASPIAKAGSRGDGVITATKLYTYLRDCVEQQTEACAKRQTPGLYAMKNHDKGEYIFLTPGHPLNLPPAPLLDESSNPYQGLAAFEEKDSNLFFGRETLTKKLHEFVDGHPLSVVLGTSGSGKSSLVKAGLIPALKQQQETNTDLWTIFPPMRPGESPFIALNNILVQADLPLIDLQIATTEARSKALGRSIAVWRKAHPQGKLLLTIDQSEELITLCRSSEERNQFLQVLATTLTDYAGSLRIVLTLRSDFEPQFRNTSLESIWIDSRFIVSAMTREELRAAIEEPASARTMYFEPYNLVEQLIDEVAQTPGALPLLSFGLSELYRKYLHRQQAADQRKPIDRSMTQADYRKLGGVTRSLTQRADQEYEALVKQDTTYAETIRNVMLRMVAVEGELARRRVPRAELEYLEPENSRVEMVIRCFENARLLTSGTDAEDKSYVEPAHEELVRGWNKLLEWKQKNLASLLLQRELTPTADKWADNQKQKQSVGLLWAGDPRLPLVEQIRQSEAGSWLNAIETNFVDRSIQRRRNNRYRLVGAISTFVLGVIVFAGVQSIQAFNARVGSLASSSNSLFNSARQLDGLLEAIRSGTAIQHAGWATNNTQTQVLATLQRAVYGVNEQNRFRHEDPFRNQAPLKVVFSPDGQTIASISGGFIHIWNIDGSLLSTLNKSLISSINVDRYEAKDLVFSPDKQSIASISDEGLLFIWNYVTGELNQLSFQENLPEAFKISFLPDGTLVVIRKNASVDFWRADGQQLMMPDVNLCGLAEIRQDDSKNDVAFSPDRQWMAITKANDAIKLCNLITFEVSSLQRGNEESVPTQFDEERHLQLSFSSDSRTVFAFDNDSGVTAWSVEGELLDDQPHFRFLNNDFGERSVLSPDGKTAAVFRNNNVEILDADRDILGVLEGHTGEVYEVAFSPTNEFVATASEDGIIQLWKTPRTDANTFVSTKYSAFDTGRLELSDYNISDINLTRNASFSSDGQYFALPNADDNVTLFSSDGQEVGILETPKESVVNGRSTTVARITFSNDNQTIAVLMSSGKVRLWNLQGEIQDTLEWSKVVKDEFYESDRMLALDFNSQNQPIVSVGDSADSIKLWNLSTQKIQELGGEGGWGNWVVGAQFSPDKQKIAVLRGNKIEIWNLDGQLIRTLEGHTEQVVGVAFSSNGETLASASQDSTVKLWNVETDQELQTFSGHSATVNSVSFSPDDKTIISGGEDNTLRFWNINGSLISTMNNPNGAVDDIGFSPDGKVMAIASSSGQQSNVSFMSQDIDELLAQGCNLLKNYFQANPNVEGRDVCNGIWQQPTEALQKTSQPAQVVYEYYKAATNQDRYEEAWQKLSTNFQNKYVPNGYAAFVESLQQVEYINIEQIKLIEESTEGAVVDVRFNETLKSTNNSSTEVPGSSITSIMPIFRSYRFYLVRDSTNSWIINEWEKFAN